MWFIIINKDLKNGLFSETLVNRPALGSIRVSNWVEELKSSVLSVSIVLKFYSSPFWPFLSYV